MAEVNPFDPQTLVLIALLNPAVVVVAFLMGRRANEPQKLIIAAFAASLVGITLYWLVSMAGLVEIHALGGEAGIFVLQVLFGLVWAGIGYAFFRR